MTDYLTKRDFYIPKNAGRINSNTDAVAYVYTFKAKIKPRNGIPYKQTRYGAMVFFGKQSKPANHYSFKTDKAAAEWISEQFAGRRARNARTAERKAERQAADRGLVVGDVLRASWGYDQTNVDYYQVTRLVGKKSVELRAIAAESIESGATAYSGKCVPLPGKFIGEPFKRRAVEGSVRIDSVAHAFKVSYTETVPGVKVYESTYWSAYA